MMRPRRIAPILMLRSADGGLHYDTDYILERAKAYRNAHSRVQLLIQLQCIASALPSLHRRTSHVERYVKAVTA